WASRSSSTTSIRIDSPDHALRIRRKAREGLLRAPMRSCLIDINGNEARTALAVGHKQQHAAAPALLGFRHTGLEIGRRMDGLVADPQHHIAGLQTLVGGIAV